MKRLGNNKVFLPAGEYIEIIDYDPATGVFYPPVNLDKTLIYLHRME